MQSRRLLLMIPITLATCCPPTPTKTTTPPGGGSGSATVVPPAGFSLDGLADGAVVHGFTAQTLYLDDADKPIGARFIHAKTKFVFDYLRIESAPQGFIWVNSFPTSDKGEPHTQEHLLLGKGDAGRKLGSSEAMALAESSAFTAQWRTAYHFHTVAGQDVFWPVFANHLDALLNPDYTDEEIRREVRNFGVDKSDDGKLRLEEKGTVYNEMVRTYENPMVVLFRDAGQLVYGKTHPLALDSGGHPDAIRTMTPEDIRAFHHGAYHLANMGMIGAFPGSMALDTVLDQTAAVLDKEAGRTGKVSTEADLPKPAAAAPGTIHVVEYPYSDTTNPGPMMFAWPATRNLDDTERTLLGLFLDAFAGDEGTTLYKKLIDSKTRVMDLGANGVWAYTSNDQGQPVYLGASGVKPDKLDDKTLADVRTLVVAELDRIAKLPDGDAELAAFDTRVQSRVIDLQRRFDKFLDSPPGFGFRGTGEDWMNHLQTLSRSTGFKKSLTMRPALVGVQKILAGKSNPWRDRLRTWGLLDTPFAIAAKPSPAMRAKLDTEHKARIDAELARLQKTYGTKDAPSTLARYQKDYDTETKKLEDSAKAAELPPLVSSLPMTLDDGLKYNLGDLGNVKTFTATFDSMASARVQLAFRANGAIAPDDMVYLAAFPSLLSDAGVVIDGKPIAADEMRERIRKEILELSVYFADNARTGRVELIVAGAGNGVAETRLALGWMRHVMFAPDWRIENLPRLRDLVDQHLTGLRQRMLGAEEGWVDDPRDAWRQQSSLQAHTGSFLTQMHDLHRLRWMLLDPRDAKVTDEGVAFLTALGDAKLPRKDLIDLAQTLAKIGDPKPTKKPAFDRWVTPAGKLSPAARTLAIAAGKDLATLVSDLPDGSLAADWKYLCREMAHDLKLGAPNALARLEEIRSQLIQAPRTRLVEVGSSASHKQLAPDVEKLAHAITTPQQAHAYGGTLERPFRDRLHERDPKADQPTFVGLVAPGTSSGVFLNMSPLTWYGDIGDDAVLDYLASNLYTGHGGHSIFMKTWAAGLAYSNGLRPDINNGVLVYYAERTPLLPQTLRFVIDQLRKARPDASIARYAIATAFASRVANGYESRASAMAANLVDGITPDVVRAFRSRVLELAKRPDLAETLFKRMEAVYGTVLPGYGKLAPGATYFVIGPEKQLAAYEDYLRATYGKDSKLFRLYPRDFWIPAKL
jgi:Zn-dependent M16 (insulinase) family peptidase